MEISKGYYDYCIPEACAQSPNFDKFLSYIYELGYRTIAINQVIDERGLEPKKKKKKGEPRESSEIVPLPIKTIHNLDKYPDLKLLSRLTIVFSTQDNVHKILKSPNIKKYHILAALPTSQNAFNFTVAQMEIDLISFNSENKLPFKIKRKIYNQAVDRNIFFEILYSPAIIDGTHRKNTIQVSHFYHSIGKSKNIVVSSGATKWLQVRSPYDVINLGLIFGLSQAQAKFSIAEAGRRVFLRSIGRRHGKAIMFAQSSESTIETEKEERKSDDEVEMDDQPAQKKSKQ